VSRPRVVLVGYNPRWPDLFARVRQQIDAALGGTAVAIEHAGSTSVPGLAAKPIIDVVVLVESFARPLVEPMQAIGFEYRPPEAAGLPFRRYFDRRPGAGAGPEVEPGCHVHVYEVGNTPDRLLEFRDALRAHPEAATGYEALKRRLARRHPDDVEAYTRGKSDFIAAVLAGSAPTTASAV
jgi:GrpB-like predicted nucleotidyltransferase (UPF0157 family)